MKALITGASGILGTDIVKQCQLLNWETLGFNSKNIDIANFQAVKAQIVNFRPDIVIHSAAMTNVDNCEDDRKAAISINVIGTQNMAVAAAKANAKFIYVSSCGVYGEGKAAPYNELDLAKPINFHHFTKLQGEYRVKEHHLEHLIIRPGWLFGGTQLHKKNFVEARRKEALENRILKSADDKTGSPTYTLDLAIQLMTLIEQEMVGTFNIVNEDCATRFEYVKEIVNLFKINSVVEPVSSNLFPRRANMPHNECLDNMNMNLRGITKMRSWKTALKDYIQTTY